MKPIMYLASPYTHMDKEIQHMRYLAVRDTAAQLMRDGEFVLSPIVHCHPMAVSCDLKGDIDFWRDYDFAMIEALPRFGILTLPGWEKSDGITEEQSHATFLGRDTDFVSPIGTYADLLQTKDRLAL